MADPALMMLTSIAIILMIGILGTIFSDKVKIPEILFLIFLGILIGTVMDLYQTDSAKLFQFSDTFIISISILALSMLIFDGSSKFKLRELDRMSIISLKYIVTLLFMSAILLGLIISLLFPEFPYNTQDVLFGAIFAIMLVATDAASVFAMLKDQSHKVLSLIKVESIFNTPITVILPLIIFEFIQKSGEIDVVTTIIDYISPFILQIVVGIGTGVLFGLILFKAMKRFYSEKLSPLAIITSALMTYVLAEMFKGSGVLAVAVLGFVFGSVYVRQKESLMNFSSVFATSLEILVFVLLGIVVKLPINAEFFFKSFVVFFVLVMLRYGTAVLTLKEMNLNFKERVFLSTVMPKGISVAVVAFFFATFGTEQVNALIQMTFCIMIYSLILTTAMVKFSRKMLLDDGVKTTLAKIQKKKAAEDTFTNID